jgi:hypothetical protein
MAGNPRKPNFAGGRPAEIRPQGPTGFEAEVRRLGLNDQTCEGSRELRKWCERNKDRFYIPEWLLKRWGISVDPNVSV